MLRTTLCALGLLSCVGCATYMDLGDGRYGVTKVSEERSPFGTNAGFAFLANCKGTQVEGYNYEKLEFSDCHRITEIAPISSQGQGGQIVGGALTGLGFGLGSAFGGSATSSSAGANSSSNAFSSSSATSTAIGGGKGH